MSFRIKSAALITSIQDLGRNGYLRFGLPHSGPMDWWAFRAANLLVGNSANCACIEVGMTSCSLLIEKETLIAVCGMGYRLHRNQRQMPLWMGFLAQPGDHIMLEKCSGGNWVYLAVAGGIQSDIWLGSRSVYPRGKLGHHLQDGDQLPVERLSPQSRMLAGRCFPVSLRPTYSQKPILRVVNGPDLDRFQTEARKTFFEQPYQVSSQSDRMGYRLSGPPVLHQQRADIVSRGIAMGEIQVPGDGQPIVMMADHPTAGGYTSIGTIIKVDLPLLAQSQPYLAKIRFATVSVAEAQRLLADNLNDIDINLNEQEDLWLNL